MAANPTYQQVCTQTTNHAETVQINYDQQQISLETILDHYFNIIDPYSLNKQGNDEGTQYRTGIYYINEVDQQVVVNYLNVKQQQTPKQINVEHNYLTNFYDAETYHQKYLDKDPNGYCHIDVQASLKRMQKILNSKRFL